MTRKSDRAVRLLVEPCPFCRQKAAELWRNENEPIRQFQVRCGACGAQGPACDCGEESAVPAWLFGTSAAAGEPVGSFQQRVHPWAVACFGPTIPFDKTERCDRFIEEALELAQSLGWTADRAHALVDYVFGHPAGEPAQEVGGVMVTLAALCNAFGLDMDASGETELARISAPEIIAKIREKQAAKPTGSALPIAAAQNALPPLSDIRMALADAIDVAMQPKFGDHAARCAIAANRCLATLRNLGFAIPEDQAEVPANGLPRGQSS